MAIHDTDDDDEGTSLLAGRVSQQQALKYPVPVYFIILFELFERYSHYTLQTILAVYCSTALSYSDDASTVIFHVYIFLIYLLPLFGPIVADGWIGNFNTILVFSVLYLIGNVLVTLGSAPQVLGFDARWTSFIGLFLNAVGTGVIKPCVSTFGGEQFTLPEQQKHLDRFFSLFIFVINVSSLLAMFISPVLRHDVTCLGQDGCYPLAYGVATLSMALAVVILLVGYNTYVFRPRDGNVLVDVAKCVGYAIFKTRRTTKAHWLDHADDKYDVTLIDDIKATMRVLVLFFPLPVYWALYLQLGSRWTLQATKMDGAMGFYTVKPEQVQVLNSVLMLVFIPLFDLCIYPLLSKCGVMKRPLQRLGVGMLLGAVAFILSALVQLRVQSTYALLPAANEAQLRLFNSFNCSMNVELSFSPNVTSKLVLGPIDMHPALSVPVTEGQERRIDARVTAWNTTTPCYNMTPWIGEIVLTAQQATSYLLTYSSSDELLLARVWPFDDVNKASSGNPKIRLVYGLGGSPHNVTLTDKDNPDKVLDFHLDPGAYGTNTTQADPTSYWVAYDDARAAEVTLKEGAVYTLLMQPDLLTQHMNVRLVSLTSANSVPMYWLIPQHVVLAMSEVLVSITGLTFSFTQAPSRMKNLLTAAWLMTVALGNLLVVFVAELKLFESQANEYFLFAGLMLAVFLVFLVSAIRYKYVEDTDKDNKSDRRRSEGYNTLHNGQAHD